MPLIRPFPGLRPLPAKAAEVAAPPYDVLDSNEARERAKGKPWSFLHISKPEIDLPPGTDPYSPEVYAKGKENFEPPACGRRAEAGRRPLLLPLPADHGRSPADRAWSPPPAWRDYDTNRIRKHEFTRPDKEDDRVRQVDALNAQTGPVFLTYKHNVAIDELVATVTSAAPEIDIVADTGVRHSLWVVRDAAQIDLITRTFDAMDCLYIADGHHRSAAASRVAASRKAANPGHTGEEAYNYFLSVIFPDNQMQILDYNRVLKDLHGNSPEQFLAKLEDAFTVEKAGGQCKPGKTGEFGMYLGRQWYRLTIKPELIPQADPVKRLDVSLLQDNLVGPILGIADPRRDKRIDFVGGIRGLNELERRVDSGEMVVAFAFYATSMAQLMSVADAGEVMPPKSTWFEPKLADGLVSHLL